MVCHRVTWRRAPQPRQLEHGTLTTTDRTNHSVVGYRLHSQQDTAMFHVLPSLVSTLWPTQLFSFSLHHPLNIFLSYFFYFQVQSFWT